MKKYNLILFDLDGTLLDTSKGICNSVRYAERKMGFAKIPDNELRQFMGPPPAEIYQKMYGISSKEAYEAAKYHREYGRKKAIYEAEVYEGIAEGLEILKKSGKQLGVATLKAEDIAIEILRNYRLLDFFHIVCGMGEQEKQSKSDLITKARAKIGMERENSVFIGDSIFDYIGAQEAEVDFFAVLYGFGFHDANNLDGKRIEGILRTPDEIAGFAV